MTPHQIHMRTQRLEHEIADAVRRLVDRYTEATGVYPTAIDIDTLDISSLGARRRRLIVGACRVQVDPLEDIKP